MWGTILDELRELAWLASLITVLSVFGVGVALALVVT